MSDHPDLDLVRRVYTAFAEGNATELERLFDLDVEHVVPGKHALAGTFHGRAEVLANLRTTVAATDGSLNVTVEGLFTTTTGQVIALDRSRASRHGHTIDEPGAILFTIAHGRIIKMVEFYADPAEIERFWA
ncbi:nuclear transport factor 2 family protein [Streptomyces noboritoensis]|uniref:Nuclear transport factor 2 family protein n=1 Tax=Streptomyces noboritoensis TaxID=67337 RepID=A0ABV6TD83_9ACTN